MTLVEFLLARVAEDEARAIAARDSAMVYDLEDTAWDELNYLASGEGADESCLALMRLPRR